MRNLLLVIVAPFALAACAANLDPDASEGEAQEIGGPEEIGEAAEIGEAGQALGPEAPCPSPGGPYACNIIRASTCNDVKLACSMGIAAVEIVPGAPVACATLLLTTCVGGYGACYAGCYAAARMKD